MLSEIVNGSSSSFLYSAMKLLIIFRLVSSSGGWISIVAPELKRETYRSSKSIFFGARSAEKTNCFPLGIILLKIRNKVSRVPGFPCNPWISSISNTSACWKKFSKFLKLCLSTFFSIAASE